MTTSRTCAIPASIDDGCASIVVERADTKPPSSLGGGATAAPPVSLSTFLRRISRGNGQGSALVLQLAQGDTGRHPIARFGRSPPSIRPARAPADGRVGARTRSRRALGQIG